ncbi:hypothetical protein DFH11DRAFT_1690281 [Phellopilus nigrolimitatus]|nr:hypothetical protein DFH11DRAFT_1690281 [Phellopilus nigrolimitatus]
MHFFIPPEIVVTVFSNLDWRTLVRCSVVCRFWRQLIRETLALQYKIELGANGVDDGPAGGLSVTERMRLLLERRRAWRALDFKRCVPMSTPGECHAYELVGGVFAKAMNPQGVMGLVSNPGSRHLSLIKLPSAGAEGESIVREDVGLLCRDFAMDPTQDLIALLEQPNSEAPSVSVHLRTISTNANHPLASAPVLKHSLKAPFEGAEMQICDDVVAIFIRILNVPRLLIWQWTTGKLLVHELNCLTCRFIDDFSLISNRAFMMTSRSPQGAIRVHTFWAPEFDDPINNGRGSSSKDWKVGCTALLFPALQPNNHYAELSSHTAPFTAHIPKGKPFAASEDARVHVMSVTTQPTQPPHSNSDSELGFPTVGHVASFIVVVRNRILLKYAERKCAMNTRGNTITEVPWEEWGPRNTRWLPERSTHAWLRYVHGARVVRALHSAWPSTRCRMQVLDFCVHPLRAGEDDRACEAADRAEPDVACAHRLVVGPSLIRDRAVFKGGGVESRLPYREATMKTEVGPYSGFMIDEERVIGLSAMAFANGDMKQVDVFTF